MRPDFPGAPTVIENQFAVAVPLGVEVGSVLDAAVLLEIP